jgi:hypothetical protein
MRHVSTSPRLILVARQASASETRFSSSFWAPLSALADWRSTVNSSYYFHHIHRVVTFFPAVLLLDMGFLPFVRLSASTKDLGCVMTSRDAQGVSLSLSYPCSADLVFI